jgi:hypothetical protein
MKFQKKSFVIGIGRWRFSQRQNTARLAALGGEWLVTCPPNPHCPPNPPKAGNAGSAGK